MFYKVVIYTSTQRLECRSVYREYREARDLFNKAREIYDELPLDVICSLERNTKTIEAYRFTRTHSNFLVDPQSRAFCKLQANAIQKTGVHRPMELTYKTKKIVGEGIESREQTIGDYLDTEGVPCAKKSFFYRIRDLISHITCSKGDKVTVDPSTRV